MSLRLPPARNADSENRRGHARPCSIERRHQDYYLVSEKMLATESYKTSVGAGDADRLPVVELRPFTKKQWRPSKSVPDPDVDRRPFTSIRSALSSRGVPFEAAGYPDPDRQVTITPRVHVGPSPRSVVASPERRTQHPPVRESREIYVEYDPWRARSRHPDHPDGFVPKVERERSTVAEVQTGNSVCTQYSCLKRAITEGDTRRQQVMRVHGRRIDHQPHKANSLYGDIEDYYRLTKSCTAPSSETLQSDDRALEIRRQRNQATDGVRVRMATIQTAYLDESIYDVFDRSNTLPSIRVRKAPLKSRKRYPEDGDSSRRSSAQRNHVPAYRLGVTNSLHLMSHIGKPVSVEYKLSDELRTALSSLRRNKDNGSIISGPYKIIPRYEMTSTRGESRMTSRTQENQSKAVTESRQNSQSHRNQYLSRASTRGRSDMLDSGIESTGGCYSPVKPVTRGMDARRKGAATGSEKPIMANIPTDTKGYASSDTSGTNPPPEHGVYYSQRQHNTPQDQSETPSEVSKQEVNRSNESGPSPPDMTTQEAEGSEPDERLASRDGEETGDGTMAALPSGGNDVDDDDDDRKTTDDPKVDEHVTHDVERSEQSANDDENSRQAESAVVSQSDSSVSERSDDVTYGGDEAMNYDQPEASTLIPAYSVN